MRRARAIRPAMRRRCAAVVAARRPRRCRAERCRVQAIRSHLPEAAAARRRGGRAATKLRMTLYQEDDFGGLAQRHGSTACLRDRVRPPAAHDELGVPAAGVQRARLGRTGGVAQDRIRENGPPYPPRTGIETGSARGSARRAAAASTLPATRRVRSTAGRTSRARVGTRTRAAARPLTFADAELGAEHAGEHELPEWGGWPVAVEGCARSTPRATLTTRRRRRRRRRRRGGARYGGRDGDRGARSGGGLLGRPRACDRRAAARHGRRPRPPHDAAHVHQGRAAAVQAVEGVRAPHADRGRRAASTHGRSWTL